MSVARHECKQWLGFLAKFVAAHVMCIIKQFKKAAIAFSGNKHFVFSMLWKQHGHV